MSIDFAFDGTLYMRDALSEIFITLIETVVLVGLVVLLLMHPRRTPGIRKRQLGSEVVVASVRIVLARCEPIMKLVVGLGDTERESARGFEVVVHDPNQGPGVRVVSFAPPKVDAIACGD